MFYLQIKQIYWFLSLMIAWLTIMNGRQEIRYECTNMGKVKQLELWWQCMSRHFWSRTYKISGQFIGLPTSKNRSLFPAFAWRESGNPFLLDIKHLAELHLPLIMPTSHYTVLYLHNIWLMVLKKKKA